MILSPEEFYKKHGVTNHLATHHHKSQDPSVIEKMKDRVLHHCRFIPDFKIRSLEVLNHTYSTGDTTEAVNFDEKGRKSRKLVAQPGAPFVFVSFDDPRPDKTAAYETIHFYGEAWRLEFSIGTHKGLTPIYFCDGEIIRELYKNANPKLYESIQWKEDLVFINSGFCERAGIGSEDKDRQQTPASRHIALWQWIIGPYSSNAYQKSPTPIPGVTTKNFAKATPEQLALLGALKNG